MYNYINNNSLLVIGGHTMDNSLCNIIDCIALILAKIILDTEY